jgi:hypothetical protein
MNPNTRRDFFRTALGTAGAALAAGFSQERILEAAVQTAVKTPVQLDVRLPIPPRIQWEELSGYCGECSIQQSALYYGSYVSQYACRSIINPNQKRQYLVGVHESKVLPALRLTYSLFDHSKVTQPEYQGYFLWVKQQLNMKRPVMIVCFVSDLQDPQYDHIMLATGFTSIDSTAYHASDKLYFNDNFKTTVVDRSASMLNDNREMLANGSLFDFCVPTDIDYGCAITGIQDSSGAALPVRMELNRNDEPNLIQKKAPVNLSAVLTVSNMQVGKSYALYRYNNYLDVPVRNYASSKYSSVVKFVPKQTTQTFPATILSNGVAIFRCLPAGL